MNIAQYDKTARGINALIYDYYAKAIIEKSGIVQGACLDVGSGGGYMGLALAKITNLSFIFLDVSSKSIETAEANIVKDGLQKRAKTIEADIHKMPLPDGSVNLVISRGSIPFWEDPGTALKEIYRVLALGGKAYVITGRGSSEIRAQIEDKRKELGMRDTWASDKGPHKHGRKDATQRNYLEMLQEIGITNCSVTKEDDGNWIHLWK